jgi:hypothetical protein
LLALLSEVAIALARYEMKGARKIVAESGRRRTSVEKSCTESIVWSLSHLTVTRIVERGVRKKAVFSNWGSISEEFFANIGARGFLWGPIGAQTLGPHVRNVAKTFSESHEGRQMSNELA